MSLKCPRDANELEPGHEHGVPVAACSTCHGGWYDLHALEELEGTATQDAEARAGTIEFLETEGRAQMSVVRQGDADVRLSCPRPPA